MTMPVLPLARLGLHLFVGLWKTAVLFPWLDEAGRNRRIQRWSLQLVDICGVSLERDAERHETRVSRALII